MSASTDTSSMSTSTDMTTSSPMGSDMSKPPAGK
jgi:hypothetical protein